MKYFIFALLGLSLSASASLERHFVCDEIVPQEARPREPAPIAYLTVRGGELGPRVFAALSIPVGRTAKGKVKRKLLTVKECGRDQLTGKPDFSCLYLGSGYRLDVSLGANDMPVDNYVLTVRTGRDTAEQPRYLYCSMRIH